MTAIPADVAVAELEPDSSWLLFAALALGLAGVMRILDAIWAFNYAGPLPDDLRGGLLGTRLDNYAWTWLAVGSILIISSGLLFVRSQFARWIGFIAATIGAISAMTWMPYYPVWSLAYLMVSVLVFWALVRYGGRRGQTTQP